MHIRKPLIAAAATVALAAGALASFAGLGTAAAMRSSTTATAATPGGVRIAYYDQWSVYGNAFYPKHLDTRGIAGKLDVINYSFGNIHPTNLTCFEANKAAGDDNNPNAGDGAGDSYADYQKSFGAADSVSGVADKWDQPIVGVFNQFKQLKAKYPHLKINISIGGWTYSKYFSDAAKTDASRKKLVSSCIDQYIKGNLPVEGGFGGAGTAAGIFDGIDIDWEYPGSMRRPPGQPLRPRGQAELHAPAQGVPRAARRLRRGQRREEVPADRGAPGLPGQDQVHRDGQDRFVPRLREHHDLRHARRLGRRRADVPPVPAGQLGRRPDRPDRAGHPEVRRQERHRLLDRRQPGLRDRGRLPRSAS